MFAEKNSFELQWMDEDMVKSRRGLAICGQPKLNSTDKPDSLEVVWEEPQSSTPWT